MKFAAVADAATGRAVPERFQAPEVKKRGARVSRTRSELPNRQVKRQELIEKYSTVFQENEFPPMRGEPMKIQLKGIPEEDKPRPCLTARSIPYAYRDQAKNEVDKLVKQGVIRPVAHATEFCSPFMAVGKPNGGIRLVVDYRGLNKFVR